MPEILVGTHHDQVGRRADGGADSTGVGREGDPKKKRNLESFASAVLDDGHGHGKHHQGGGGVGNPHTQEGSGYHEAEDEKFFPGRAGVHHHQGDPPVGSALFHGFGQKKTAKQK